MGICKGWVVAMVVGSGVLVGCENTPRALSAGDQAAAQRTRCAEFSDAAIAPVLDGSNVERVEPLYTGSASKSSNPRLRGAALVVRPSRGDTAEWLDRALECHESHVIAAQAGASTQRTDPFWLPGSQVQIEVMSAHDGFRIELSGASSADAREILSRAQALQNTQMGGPENATAVFEAR